MESQQPQQTSPQVIISSGNQNSTSTSEDASYRDTDSTFSISSVSSWARNIKLSKLSSQGDSQSGNVEKSTFSRLTTRLSFRSSPKSSQPEENVADDTSTNAQPGVLGSLTRGLVDTSKNAVKAVRVKAQHIVSQNKRRYQEGGFDLDMTYITENIIAMGFPAGDLSSGFFGYVEGFYRNHMEEVIQFFETHHKGKYKVYNLCSERLYDASLFEGKVACFPFDDHNCPPIRLISSFCQSAYSWLKEDIENVVVVHCKAGMARTGLMISSLLLYLKFFPTAEESMEYYNQKRCIDGKGLVLPSQIRYVRYFERILGYFNGENRPGRRCLVRGFRLHECPYWIRPSITISYHDGVLFSTKKHPRTKNMMPEEFWFKAPKKGIMVFALPGELGLTEVSGDFKIHFHDRQGDFYCWLNTTLTENRTMLNTSDLDGFDKRKLPSPGFQVEVVLVDYDGSSPPQKTYPSANKESASVATSTTESGTPPSEVDSNSKSGGKDEIPSGGEAEENGFNMSRHDKIAAHVDGSTVTTKQTEQKASNEEDTNIEQAIGQVSLEKVSDAANVKNEGRSSKNLPTTETPQMESTSMSEFKAIAADASVFSFGDEEDYDSE